MGKANWVHSQKTGGKISVFYWLREVWFGSNYPEFPKKKSKGSRNQDPTVFV